MTAQPTEPHVGLVVEGAGDRESLPLLLRNHLNGQGEFRDILGKAVPTHGRSKAFAPRGLEGYVATAASRPGCVGVLIVLDGDKDCVATEGVELKRRATEVSRVPVEVALAQVDFEDWLYASAETLELGLEAYDPRRRGQRAIRAALQPVSYTKPIWQPRLTARVDIALARSRSQSLDRMLQRFDRLRGSI